MFPFTKKEKLEDWIQYYKEFNLYPTEYFILLESEKGRRNYPLRNYPFSILKNSN